MAATRESMATTAWFLPWATRLEQSCTGPTVKLTGGAHGVQPWLDQTALVGDSARFTWSRYRQGWRSRAKVHHATGLSAAYSDQCNSATRQCKTIDLVYLVHMYSWILSSCESEGLETMSLHDGMHQTPTRATCRVVPGGPARSH